MLRNLGDLEKECLAVGIIVPSKPSKEHLEILLRDFYWARNHAGEQMPLQLEVNLAQKLRDMDEETQKEIWNDSNWTAEVKENGVRITIQIDAEGNLRFFSRNKSVKDFLYVEKTANLPFHTEIKLKALANTIIDGEFKSLISHANTGGTETHNQLNTISAIINAGPDVAVEFQRKYGPFQFVMFDVIKYCGEDLSEKPFSFRRKVRAGIATIFKSLPVTTKTPLFVEVEGVDQNKFQFYEDMIKQGEEGVMLKDLRAPYEFGKRRWTLLKVKKFVDYDAFITGFVPSDQKKGIKDLIGALEFSIIEEGTGNQRIIGAVSSMPLEFRKWATKNPGPNCELNPELFHKVGVIRGQEFSAKNFRLTHCTFVPGWWDQVVQGLNWLDYFRKDKNAEDCKVDMALVIKEIMGTK